MPPKKNKPKNAFFHFMLDFKYKHKGKYKDMKEVAEAAGPIWSNMTPSQKRHYEAKACREKQNHSNTNVKRKEEMIEREAINKSMSIKSEISQILENAAYNNSIEYENFFLIHINTFCYCPVRKRYYPAEIAIASLTLKFGVCSKSDVFHSMINPGPLPIGYAAGALENSELSHRIRPSMAREDENNIETVLNEMIDFLQLKMNGSVRMPHLYTNEKDVEMVQSILTSWCLLHDKDENLFTICSLQYMFYLLKNTVARTDVWPSQSFSESELEKETFDHATEITCSYHEDVASLFCSKSIIIRYAYVICDNCCQYLQIPVLPGYHMPKNPLIIPSSRSRDGPPRKFEIRAKPDEHLDAEEFWDYTSNGNRSTTQTPRREHSNNYERQQIKQEISPSSSFRERIIYPSTSRRNNVEPSTSQADKIIYPSILKKTDEPIVIEGDPSDFPIIKKEKFK